MTIPAALLTRSENRILQLCARGASKSEEFGTILGEVQDWNYLTTQLSFHRLTLFFLHHVRGYEILVPVEVLEELQHQGEETLYLNLFLLTELQWITRMLTEQGVRVLSYKGPSIAYNAYGTLALRRFVDLDLVVSSREWAKVVSSLKKADFQEFVAQTALTPYLRRPKAKTDYELQFRSREGKTFLDLHWSVTAPFESFPLRFETMWKRRVLAGSIDGVYTLCREDLIVALCFHGLKHCWEEMEWIGCLLNLVQQGTEEPLNWRIIEAAIRSSGCQRVLYLGLRLAHDLADETQQERVRQSVPAAIWQKMGSDKVVKQMAQCVWCNVLGRNAQQEKGSNPYQFIRDYFLRFSLGLRARRGWRTRRVFFVGMLRIGLLSLERSTVASQFVESLSKFVERITRRNSS